MNTLLANGFHLGVKVGGKELIFSGFVHTDQLKVEVEFSNMVVEFNFISEDVGGPRYDSSIEGTQKLIFNLYNHNNVLGEGVLRPMEIGQHENRRLLFTYLVSTLNKAENQRRLEFAFYLGDKL